VSYVNQPQTVRAAPVYLDASEVNYRPSERTYTYDNRNVEYVNQPTSYTTVAQPTRTYTAAPVTTTYQHPVGTVIRGSHLSGSRVISAPHQVGQTVVR
jgi:hypothetical protein